MNNVKQVQNENDSRKIFTTLVLIFTLMICTTSATYAYFAISASSNNVITGTAATASLEFVDKDGNTGGTTDLIAPTNTTYTTTPMVPQYSLRGSTNVLQLAFNGATGKDKCVDANSNVICKAYQVRIKNLSTATAVIKGQIKFAYAANSSFANLKWKLMDSETTVTVATGNVGTTATTDFTNFVENVSLTPNSVATYNLIFWIEEIDGVQNDTDYGTFYATIQFINQIDNSGITSTITG